MAVTEFGRPGVLDWGKCHLMIYWKMLVDMKEYLSLSALDRSDQEHDMNSWYCKLYLRKLTQVATKINSDIEKLLDILDLIIV